MCKVILIGGKLEVISADHIKQFTDTCDALAREGERVLGFAQLEMDPLE